VRYRDKIKKIKSFGKEYFLRKDIYSLDIPDKGCNKIYLQTIIKKYPWIHKSYLKFLELFNGGEYDDIRLLGDENCKNGSILETARIFSSFSVDKIPIAKDSAGDVFWLDKDGKIYWISIENIGDQSSSTFIAKNFEDFMDSFCLGKKFREHYGDNEWTEFLKSQHWI